MLDFTAADFYAEDEAALHGLAAGDEEAIADGARQPGATVIYSIAGSMTAKDISGRYRAGSRMNRR